MRLLMLTTHPHLYTPRRLCAEASRRGLAVLTVVPGSEEGIGSLDASLVIARAGPFSFVRVLRSLRKLASRGATLLHTRRALLDAIDKWRCLRRLQRSHLAVPRSLLARHPQAGVARFLRSRPPPVFLKARIGSQGSHVLLGEDEHAARRGVHFLWGLGLTPILQEDLRGSGPVRRVLVAGGRAVAHALARPAPGEHRTNLRLGGEFIACGADAPIAAVAVRAVRTLGLPYAAVDLIGDPCAVLDVNASPGIEGLERSSRKNLAASLLDAAIEASPGAAGGGSSDGNRATWSQP